MDGKTAPARGSSLLRPCKCGCGTEFKPKRVDQRFATPSCKTKYTMRAYEQGLKVIESKGIHHRHLSNPHLQRILACLSDGRAWTTRELHKATNLENVSTAICELRKSGVNISRAKLVRITETGAKVYEYRLIGE